MILSLCLTLIINSVKIWSRAGQTRNAARDFVLSGSNREPKGIVFDGVSTYWIADEGTGEATAHRFASGFVYHLEDTSVAARAVVYDTGEYVISNMDDIIGLGIFNGQLLVVGALNNSAGIGRTTSITESFLIWVYGESRPTLSSSTHSSLQTGNDHAGGVFQIDNLLHIWDYDENKVYQYRFFEFYTPVGERRYRYARNQVPAFTTFGLGSSVDFLVFDEFEGFTGTYWGLSRSDGIIYALNGDFTRAATRDIPLISANNQPGIMALDGDCLIVTNSDAAHNCFSYDKNTKQELEHKRFVLQDDPGAMVVFEDAVYTAAVGASSIRVYNRQTAAVYEVVGSSVGIRPDPSWIVGGCTYIGEHLYVCYSNDSTIAVFDTATGNRVASLEIDGSPDIGFVGLTNDATHVYALTSEGELKAFHQVTKESDANLSLNLVAGDPVTGVAISGSDLYILRNGTTPHLDVYNTKLVAFVPRTRETSLVRYSVLARRAVEGLPSSGQGGRLLPTRDVGGSVRESLRRCADSELGRAVDGRLYRRGTWRDAVSGGMTESEVSAVIEGSNLVRTAQHKTIDGLVTNQFAVSDYEGTEYQAVSDASIERWGHKPRRVALDTANMDAQAVGDWLLDHWDSPYKVLEIDVNAFYEDDAMSLALLLARPHTVVYMDIPFLKARPWIVLHRAVKLVNVGNGEIDAPLHFTLVSPRQLGVGWTLSGPDSLIEDKLGDSTVLIDANY